MIYYKTNFHRQHMPEPSGRRQRKKDATRREIVEAAMKLFLDRSFDQVTVAEIAEAADVSVNTVFNYFATKEELFFSAQASGEPALLQARDSREAMVAYLRRLVADSVERYARTPASLAEIAYLAAMRRTFQDSPALRVYAAQAARTGNRDLEESFIETLAKDVNAAANDLTPRLVAGLVFTVYSTLFLEAERRWRAGERPEKIQAFLSAAAETAVNLLEKGIGNYGVKPG